MPVLTTGLTVMSSYGSWYFDELPIRADQTSVEQFCTDNSYTLSSWTADAGHWSNDGGRLMNYYGTYTYLTGTTFTTGITWQNLFSYDPIVTTITVS